MSDLPEEAMQDCFRPPDVPIEVFCLHCHQVYESYLIWWEAREDEDGMPAGFWRCPTPGCDGAGFCFDIFPIDPDYVHPETGEKIGGFFSDDEEDEDFEDDDVDDIAAFDGVNDIDEFDVVENERASNSSPAPRSTTSNQEHDESAGEIDPLPLMNDDDDDHHQQDGDHSPESNAGQQREVGGPSSTRRNRYEPGDPSRWMR